MIDHITIRVSNVEKSKEFYDKAFAALGYKRSFGKEGVFYAFDVGNSCLFEIAQNEDDGAITSSHIALRVTDKKLIESFYIEALNAGAKCNGKPGPRVNYTPGYYACFIHDLDGHNIEVMYDEAYSY